MEKLAGLAPLAVASLLITTTGHAQSPDPCEPIAGEMVSLEGEVEVQRSDAASWRAAALGQTLCEGDSVRAGALSRAAIALVNEAVLRVDENTTLRLIDIVPEEEGTSLLQLVAGIFQSFSRSPRRLAIDTPYVNATIEGTEFVLEVAENRSSVTVLEGVVALANDLGEARVASGEAAVAEAGQAPRQVIVVTPRDAVQWSLYYPPILAVEAAPGADAALARALELARAGRNVEALAALDEVPEARRDADYHVSRAALLLSVGRVEPAEAAIDRALEQDPEAGTAHALRSIIQVTRNQEQEALASARRGVEADPEASAPKVALSYALQATFDLEAARDVLLEAIRQDPDNPLLWARLAELHLSLGDRRDAREAAERAVELASAPATRSTTARPLAVIVMPAAFPAPPASAPRERTPAAAPDLAQAAPVAPAPAPRGTRSPELERALVVLGFAELAEFDTAAARGNFARAIELDPADPLPHFGLGLAQIREGDLEDGRQNIEVAVALDANSSVLRSYLGKAYFEEKRDELAGQQYEIAKELDPRDPTPYLYDAIRKQTEGRPVEALQDLERSIELNDNRAVYRSRLQLDEDRAARGTSLARIYDDLGFQELGLKEASKSIT
ncbi:MAG TPA: tetratricopeptide repeat protein, partial [Geminicoccaceae bacterium]